MINKLFFCFITCFTAVLAKAQNQFLDPTFGINGVYTYTPNNTYQFVYETGAVTSQQKVIVSGTSSTSNNSQTTNVIQRLNANGTVDNSFNMLILPPSSASPYTRFIKMSIQSDQKIILGDLMGQKLIRLNENGTYDIGFGSNGVINESIFSTFLNSHGLVGPFNLKSMVLTNTNKILLCVGVVDDQESRLGVMRLNENGSIDTSFGNNGIILQDGDFGDLKIQDDSKLIVIGQNFNGIFTKSRYSENGVLDSTYNNNPLQYTPLSGYVTYFVKAASNANNTYLYGFSSPVAGGITFITLMKLNQNGEFDSSFGTNGIVNEPYYSNNNDYYVDGNVLYPNLLLDNNSNIFLVCMASPTTTPLNRNQFVKKFKSNGSVDQNFGNGGVVDIDLNYNEFIRSSIITPDQKIMIFGNHQTPNKGIITRILNNNNVLATDDISKESFKIHPNPAENFINVGLLKNNKFSEGQIFDVNGRIILTASIKNGTIDVKSLPRGVYFLKIGEISHKFIKK